MLGGGFPESLLRKAGCAEIHPEPAALLACLRNSLLVTARQSNFAISGQKAELSGCNQADQRMYESGPQRSW